MDSKQFKNIGYYQSCDELPMFNWIKLHKTEEPDLRWLLFDFNGFQNIEFPKGKLEKAYDAISEEYEALTRNKKSTDYYELILDISDAELRIKIVTTLLFTLAKNPFKPAETLKQYIDELHHWRFYINKDMPLSEELPRMKMQLKAVQMKLNQMYKDKKDIEKGLKSENTPILKLKTKVENIHGRTFDFRIMTVSEWVYAFQDALNKKKSA